MTHEEYCKYKGLADALRMAIESYNYAVDAMKEAQLSFRVDSYIPGETPADVLSLRGPGRGYLKLDYISKTETF